MQTTLEAELNRIEESLDAAYGPTPPRLSLGSSNDYQALPTGAPLLPLVSGSPYGRAPTRRVRRASSSDSDWAAELIRDASQRLDVQHLDELLSRLHKEGQDAARRRMQQWVDEVTRGPRSHVKVKPSGFGRGHLFRGVSLTMSEVRKTWDELCWQERDRCIPQVTARSATSDTRTR